MSAGEQLPITLFERWRTVVGRPIHEGYGCSETLSLAIASRPGEAAAGVTGRLVPASRARLLDDAGVPVADGQPGILHLHHPCMFLGYWRNGGLDRSALSDGWFCTNDVFARDPGGNWRHLGRSDGRLKVAGQWLDRAEVDRVVARLPSIAEWAALTAPDADGFQRVALFAVPVAADEASRNACAAEIAKALEAALPRHKRPRWVRLIDGLPRTSTGKVAHAALARLLAQSPHEAY